MGFVGCLIENSMVGNGDGSSEVFGIGFLPEACVAWSSVVFCEKCGL